MQSAFGFAILLLVLLTIALWPELRLVFGDVFAILVPLLAVACVVGFGALQTRRAAKRASKLPALMLSDARGNILWSSPGAGGLLRKIAPENSLGLVPLELHDGTLMWHKPQPAAPVAENSILDLIELLPVSILSLNHEGRIINANGAARALLGADDLRGVLLENQAEGLGRSMRERITEAAAGEISRRSEIARCQRDGQEMYVQVSLMHEAGTGGNLIAVLSDKTELKTLEAQFVQSQKMQAVGQLAGGVAHDFNNLLTAISGHVDLLLLRHESGDPDYGDLIQIRQNAMRAAGLVKQLLAFSRKQTLQPKVLNMMDTLSELAHLLNRLLGEKVTLAIEYGDALWPVRVDERQLEQVIMNLVVNARDAMPSGGQVDISSHNETLAHPLRRNRAIVPAGRYVVLRVTDTGCGIDPDKLDKIFEPFFTTKRIGEGTGLGLSTAYGIIKQTGGYIFTDSTPGKGTCFTIYLPAHSNDQSATPVPASRSTQTKPEVTHGRILLVEDEAAVRAFAARALRLRGFDVDEADSGEAALAMLDSPGADYQLFITDVIMPGLDGPSWVRKAKPRFPNAEVVFMSGYAEDVFNDTQTSVEGAAFLAKPFSLKDLTSLASEKLVQR
ncbi:MAG: ATP-binding protein [Paracoccaceae bacterium]